MIGSWQLFGKIPITWRFGNNALMLNANQLTVTQTAAWQRPVTLAGDSILYRRKADDPVFGAGRIFDGPLRIELGFPRLPNRHYALIHHLRTFALPFLLDIGLFNAGDLTTLYSDDGLTYMAPTGGWKAGSEKVYVNGVQILAGALYSAEWGWVRLQNALGKSDIVTATYVWSPRVQCLQPTVPEYKAGIKRREAVTHLSVLELRGLANGSML